jgi:hypothetical protein
VAIFLATSNVADGDCLGNWAISNNSSPQCPATPAPAANTYTTSDIVDGPVPAGGGTVSNLEATVNTAPGVGNTHTVTVQNASTGTDLLSCQIIGTAVFCQNAGSAAVGAGAYVRVRVNHSAGAPTNSNFRVTFRY